MKSIGIYSRILLMSTLTGVFFLLLLATLYFITNKQEDLMVNASQMQFDNEVNSLITLKSSTIKQVVYDYTFWDDFVEHLKIIDTSWYRNNITTILKTFRIDYACVYDTSFKIIHEASSNGFVSRDFISMEALAKLKDARFLNFFQISSDGVLEISAASVHPDIDPSHTQTKPSGYLFLAKNWNQDFLKELRLLSGAKTNLLKPFDTIAKKDKYSISAMQKLPGWNGKDVAQIIFTRASNSLKLYHNMSVFMILIFLGSVFTTWFVFHFTTRKLINKPLRLITSILKSGNLTQISELRQCHGEFKDIGILFSEFINQKEELRLAKEHLNLRVKQRTEELETANRDLETFSYSVSHDLKAPLRHINGFIGLFLENRTTELTEEEHRYMNQITGSAKQMGQLIDALLSFSKLNLVEFQKTSIRTSEMVQQVIKFFEPDLKNRKITFNVESLPDIQGDEELIRQVWINLISNAIKYTGKKPESIIEIGSISRDNETTFFIKDNGAGFNMKYAEKLFGVFQRLHKSRDFEGIGIGLANVSRIIKRHGGQCRGESEPDRGATFYFSLPK